MKEVYSLDERMVKRKSHENEAVKLLYKDFLGEPLSHVSHTHLHTHYFARPRKPPITLNSPSTESVELGGDNSSTIYVVYGTQSGTAAQAAKEVKVELQNLIGRSNMTPEPQVCLVAGNGMYPDGLVEHLKGSLAAIFVTSTFGEGEFPSMMEKLWEFLEGSKPILFPDGSLRYAVFGLGSSMYAAGDQFNKAARQLDQKIAELGGERIIDVGLGDDQASEGYHGELDKWLEELQGKLFAKASSGSKASHLDPPEPLFRLSLAPGKHLPGFRPLPPKYHFAKLVETESLVSDGYDRPAARFCFDLDDTGLHYEVGDHLAILPRNPADPVETVLSLYSPEITGSELLSVEPIDHLTESPFPAVLTARELLSQYLDLCGRPSRSFLKQLFLFAHTVDSRDSLRSLIERDHPDYSQEKFEFYTATHTYADVLSQFARIALPPFEYLLSMVPTICPRLYSIASSPLHRENKLELLVVLIQWDDSFKKHREGLATQYLFNAYSDETVAVQILTGILQPPKEATTPIVMFGLGTGVAPFRGFLQNRQSLLDRGEKVGPATLYVGFRHEKKDYYLKEDYKKWIKSGALTAVHPAFSHDKVEERDGKLYFISDMIGEEPMDVVKALQLKPDEEPAEEKKEEESKKAPEIYYCGPALGIPETIQKSIKGALCSDKGGSMKEEEAIAFMETLVRKEYRFHAECF
jgi:sulfite reductase alpha subunit-like flavoprotein